MNNTITIAERERRSDGLRETGALTSRKLTLAKIGARPIVAVDIDDTCADYASAFAEVSNRLFGANLTAEDYDENWQVAWNAGPAECSRRVDLIAQENFTPHLKLIDGARDVLTALAKQFDLRVVTSRPTFLAPQTRGWIDENLPDIFTIIHHTTSRNLVAEGAAGARVSKGDFCRGIGAQYLIDDQPKHCLSAAEFIANSRGEILPGIQSLLFGNYRWNRDFSREVGVFGSIVQVTDWAAVAKYFNVNG